MTQDENHLNLLSIFHYVVGGITALFALFPIIHLVIGLMIVFNPPQTHENGPPFPPALFGWFFVLIALAIIVGGMTLAGFMIAAGRYLSRRQRHMFCFVVAAVECTFMPFGTALGVFTIIVLSKESVKQLFGVSTAPVPPPVPGASS